MARRLVLGLLLALLIAAPAAGHEAFDRKHAVDSELAELNAKIAQARAQEQALSAQISTVTGEIRALEREVGDVSSDLEVLEQDLALHQERLDRITALYRLQTRKLEFLRSQFDTALHRLNARLVTIYEADDPTALEVVLAARSFDELLEQLDYLNEIGAEDKRVTAEVGEAKTQMREARARTKVTRRKVAAATRVIAVRTNQVRSVRDQLLASQRRLGSVRAGKREALAAVEASKEEFLAEAAALQQVSAQLAARLQSVQSPSPQTTLPPGEVSASGLIWPTSGPVTSYFGPRWGRMHEGIDIAAPYGAPIRAAAAGTVIYAGWMGGYGNLVVVDHGGGLATAYAHASTLAVGVGQGVAQGQLIAYVGSTGHSTGPHLHFEVRVNGTPVDPLGYL
jgi:murein DD-endopeptidase MepM/ murein hydrolase activator NlpD